MFKVHADVLRMAKTKEKQERIKWFHTRRVFFDNQSPRFAEVLELARQCEHEGRLPPRLAASKWSTWVEARSGRLFPLKQTRQRRADCVLAAMCVADVDLMKECAMRGCALAQVMTQATSRTLSGSRRPQLRGSQLPCSIWPTRCSTAPSRPR